MKEKLINLLNNSYSPYSKFKVAAIVITRDEKYFCGVNVENSSYGGSICAERNAINSAISSGYKRYDFKDLYVMCDSDIIGTPCFICRATINEMFDKDCDVVCMNPRGDIKTFKVSDLCPYPFDDGNLK